MGGFLTIGYCLRTVGHCFSYFFSGNFCGGEGLDGGDKVVMWDPPVPPLGKTLD